MTKKPKRRVDSISTEEELEKYVSDQIDEMSIDEELKGDMKKSYSRLIDKLINSFDLKKEIVLSQFDSQLERSDNLKRLYAIEARLDAIEAWMKAH
ncbi:Uncharacterised protein [uncultured archaeon]|nr:Uncharacterised protein [uncultured archaeon]